MQSTKSSSPTKVSITRCSNYDMDTVLSALHESIALIGGLSSIIKKGDSVLLKVNLLSASPPDAAVTTHPAVVSGMIDIVRDAGGIPVVGDSSGIAEAGVTVKACEVSGIMDVLKEKDVEFVNFETAGYRKFEHDSIGKFYISKAVLDADVVISLAKLKTHELTVMTGALKNFFGAVPVSTRKESHANPDKDAFSDILVDIYEIIKPALGIMDAVVCMEGDGPARGTPKDVGVISASTNCAALDAVCFNIAGFEYLEIPTTKMARRRGLVNLADIEVMGAGIEDVACTFKRNAFHPIWALPAPVVGLLSRFFTIKPYIIDACVKCGVCAEHCPVDAISDDGNDGGVYIVDDKKCIQCYCCHELCPHKAVELRKSRVARMLSR